MKKFIETNLFATLEEGKHFIDTNSEKGCICPCCNQIVKLYKRKLNSGMALTLIRMYQHSIDDWINVKSFLKDNKFSNNHDWTLLRHWGLIKNRPENEVSTDNKYNGYWKITSKGIDFINNVLNVQKHIFIQSNILKGYSNEYINIIDALGDKFNYYELMSS